jgi:hypothetical protein
MGKVERFREKAEHQLWTDAHACGGQDIAVKATHVQACTLNSARLVRCGLSRRDGVCRSRSIGQSLRPPPRADLSGQGSGAKGRKATTALCFMERNGLRHHSLVAVPVLMPEASSQAGLRRDSGGLRLAKLAHGLGLCLPTTQYLQCPHRAVSALIPRLGASILWVQRFGLWLCQAHNHSWSDRRLPASYTGFGVESGDAGAIADTPGQDLSPAGESLSPSIRCSLQKSF